MTHTNIAIIGAGHMGMGLLGGLIASGYPHNQIFLAEPDASKLSPAQDQFQVNVTTHNSDACEQADVILFAVKPNTVSLIAGELKSLIQQRKPLVISIAAGIRESQIQSALGGDIAIVRAMPNMPALIGCGATALVANQFVSREQCSLAEFILNSVGTTVWLEREELMDAVTALSGSGPAYIYLLIEAMQKAGEALGLSTEVARKLTLQTAYGAAALALKSDQSAANLCRQAMTPGGTTEQAVRVFENHHFHSIVEQAIKAAADRANELAKG